MRILAILFLVAAACGGSSRTTFQRYPGSALTFDRAGANAEALAIADKVYAAHGGPAWEKAKQIRWKQAIVHEGATKASGQHAWDRWNARHWARLDSAEQPPAVFYEIYGDYFAGYVEMKSGNKQGIPQQQVKPLIDIAKNQFQRDVTVTFAPFFIFEPGAKLEYAGKVKDDAGVEYDDLKLTFDAKDPARAGLLVHVYADKDGLVKRVEVEVGADRFGYSFDKFETFGGLKVATERKNLGSGEVIKISDMKVGDPDDDLFAPPPLT